MTIRIGIRAVLVLAACLAGAPALAASPAGPPGELECAAYYLTAEFPLADPPSATEYSDLLVGLNWAIKAESTAPRKDVEAAGQPVLQFLRAHLPSPLTPHPDFVAAVQALIDRYDAPCRVYSGLPPLDMPALQAAIAARLAKVRQQSAAPAPAP